MNLRVIKKNANKSSTVYVYFNRNNTPIVTPTIPYRLRKS